MHVSFLNNSTYKIEIVSNTLRIILCVGLTLDADTDADANADDFFFCLPSSSSSANFRNTSSSVCKGHGYML